MTLCGLAEQSGSPVLQSQVEVAATNAFEAGSRTLGHPAKAASPVADTRPEPDEGERKMPRFTLEASEDRRQFCGGPSRAGPELSVTSAESPDSLHGAPEPVRGLFRELLATVLLLMLWCAVALAAEKVESQVEVAATNAFEAGSRTLGHPAKAASPVADTRHLVIRQSE
jgi:hypothetical protein